MNQACRGIKNEMKRTCVPNEILHKSLTAIYYSQAHIRNAFSEIEE